MVEDRAQADRIHRTIIVALQVIMGLELVVAVYDRQWLTAFLVTAILLTTIIPVLLARRNVMYIPAEFHLLAVLFIFASLFLGSLRGYYVRFWWWDLMLHTGSGFLLGILGFLLVHVLNQQERVDLHMTAGFVAFFSFAFALAVGALWEIFEFAIDMLGGFSMQHGLQDTMWDLVADTGGALFVSALGYFYLQASGQSFLGRWIRRFIESNTGLFGERAQE